MNRRAAFASLLVWLIGFLAPISAPFAHPAQNPWASLLVADVEEMHRVLLENHPGAVDALNKGFSQWLRAGYRQALDRARTCYSYEGYRFALEAYAVGFQDGHLGLWTELRRETVRWPGFMAGWQPDGGKSGGKLVVRVVGESKPADGAPAIGSEVISCDGKPVRELIARDVFPFSGNPDLEGKSLWRDDGDDQQARPVATKAPTNPVAGRVFLLTDTKCGSACLDFADMVRALPGAVHVGRPTSADSVYMEIREVGLPSGVARLAFSTKVYRGRPRGNNQPYVPHHTWNGSIADTPALEKWISSLPAAPRASLIAD